jgi:hypothetical protein
MKNQVICAMAVVIILPAWRSASAEMVQTHIGVIETEVGTPTRTSADKLYDEMDLGAAVQAYLWAMPAIGMAGYQHAWREVFQAEPGQFVSLSTLDDRRGVLTPNNVASYVIAIVDLSASGPIVYEDPEGNTGGALYDLWWRPLGNIGLAGPYQGKGGKFLLVGPGQEAPSAEGYEIVQSTTNTLWIGTRLLDFDVEKALKEVAPQMRTYPFDERASPKSKPLLNANSRTWGQQQPSGLAYFERLSEILNAEPVEERDRFVVATLAPLGIEKGKPFAPDERQKKILTEAARIGELTIKAAVATRRNTARYWEQSSWKLALEISADQRTEHYDEFEKRALLYWEIFGSAIPPSEPGTGSTYLVTFESRDGKWLDGGKNYRLTVPPAPPAKNFWSVTAYDEGTRTFIADTDRIGLGNQTPGYDINPDGSVDIYFGPSAPAGHENNWVQTVRGRGWFSYFRLFGPTEPYFDKTWILPDFEKID